MNFLGILRLLALSGVVLTVGCRNGADDASVGNESWPTGYVAPIPGATFSLAADHLPGSERAYRDGVHEGFDFFNGLVSRPLAANQPVVTVADGTIVRIDHGYAGDGAEALRFFAERAGDGGMIGEFALDRLRGRQVWVAHEGGFVSRYAHLAAIDPELSVGQTVAAGTEVGRVGNSGLLPPDSGSGAAPHLHFELWNARGRYLGQGLEPLGIHARVAGVFGDTALPRFARDAVASLRAGEPVPSPYPPEPLPNTAFNVDAPEALRGGSAAAVPVTWDDDEFSVDAFFAQLDRAAGGFIDAGNGAWLLLAAPLVREETAIQLVIGGTDRYGQTLIGQNELAIRPFRSPEPLEVYPDTYADHGAEAEQAEARRFAEIAAASLEIRQPLWDQPFRAPAEGAVKRQFGQQIVAGMLRPRDPFSGVEIRLDDADGVRASNAGRVALAGELPVRGPTVAVVHGGGVVSVYAGLDAIAVEAGQALARGQLLGEAGGTVDGGASVRWEIHVSGIPVDPLDWVDRLLPEA